MPVGCGISLALRGTRSWNEVMERFLNLTRLCFNPH